MSNKELLQNLDASITTGQWVRMGFQSWLRNMTVTLIGICLTGVIYYYAWADVFAASIIGFGIIYGLVALIGTLATRQVFKSIVKETKEIK